MMRASVEPLTARDGARLAAPALQAANVFQGRAWREAWLSTAPEEAALHRIVVSDETGRPRAEAFASLEKRAGAARLAGSRVWFNETGRADFDGVYAEYNDFLLGDPSDAPARRAGLDALVKAFPGTDEFVFRNVTSAMREALFRYALVADCEIEVFREQTTWRINLASLRGDGADPLERLGRSTRAAIRRTERAYAGRGAVETSIVGGAEAAEAWADLVRLHEAGWRRRGRPGAFSEPSFRRFHDHLRTHYPEAAHLLVVRVAGAPVAVLYNLVHGPVVTNYQSGFAFEDDNKIAPGLFAHVAAARLYRDMGYDDYDLLAGGDDYKSRLGVAGETLTSVSLLRRTMRMRLKAGFRRLRRARR